MLIPVAAVLGVVVHAQLAAHLPRVPLPRPAATAQRVAVHQNSTAAGTRAGRRLELALDVVEGAWRPEGSDDPEVPVLAFAEAGKTPLIPGPMIRVPQGTEVALT
ncbi:MAG: hypothetical protein JNL26_01135, partial [Gemmatimonadetes bacterium]|nr:hypothetical protein [Gemmatimonadota bacterium]